MAAVVAASACNPSSCVPGATRSPEAQCLSCPDDQVPVCFDGCLPVSREEGARCYVDTCRRTGGEPGERYGICGGGTTERGRFVPRRCLPDEPGATVGRCRAEGTLPLLGTTCRDDNDCDHEAFCIESRCPIAASRDVTLEGFCRRGVALGEACDPNCEPCERGLTCVERPGGERGVCRRVCSAATGDGCPCGAPVCSPPPSGTGDGYCCPEATNTACGGACVNVRTDLRHCGGCDRPCPSRPNARPMCLDGICLFDCAAGFADCDGDPANGCEVNLRSDPSNCGRCGEACGAPDGATATCGRSGCGVACPAELSFCGGACVNVQTNPEHCGSCGRRCAAGESCRSGACVTPNACVPEGGTCTAVTGDERERAQANCCEGSFCSNVFRCTCSPAGTPVDPTALQTYTRNYGCCDGLTLGLDRICRPVCPRTGPAPETCIVNDARDCNTPSRNCSIDTGGDCLTSGTGTSRCGWARDGGLPPAPRRSGETCRSRSGGRILVFPCEVGSCPSPEVSDLCP